MNATTLAPARRLCLVAAALALLPTTLLAQRTISATSDATTAVGDPEPPLRPGDVIEIASWREPGLAGEFTVQGDGTVTLPLIGTRDVDEIPADQLTRELQEEYGSKFRRQTVEVLPKRRVRILGAVREPGLYYVDRTMTLGDAVALAGGAAADGDWKSIRILRDGQELEAELDQASEVAREVRSGDQIVLPQRSWLSRNTGVLLGASISAAAIILTRSIGG